MNCIVFNIYFLVFKEGSRCNCSASYLKKTKFTVKYFLKTFLVKAIQDLFWGIKLFSKCRTLRVLYTQSNNLKLFVFLSVRNWELGLVCLCLCSASSAIPCCISSSLDDPLGTVKMIYAGSEWTLHLTSRYLFTHVKR